MSTTPDTPRPETPEGLGAELLRSALQHSGEFVLLLSAAGAVRFANGRVRRSLDYPGSEWERLRIWDLDTDFTEEQWIAFVTELRELGTLRFRSSLSTREGLTFPVEMTATYHRDEHGRETIFVYGFEPNLQGADSGAFRFRRRLEEEASRLESMNRRLQEEMEQRVRTEEQLRSSQDRLEMALWASKLALWDWNLDTGRLILDERATSMMVGDDAAGFSMEDWRRLVHPQDLASFEAKLQRHIEGQTEVLEVTHRFRRSDGSSRWYYAHGRASARDGEGRARRIIGTIQDVSERKALEDELLQSQKMEAIGRLAGGVAHDFNNLLTAINGYSDLVLRSLEPDDANRHRIEEVRKAGQRAAVLTNRLLSFGRKQIQQPEALDLSTVVRNLKPLLIPAVGEGIELMLDLGEVPSVHADLHQIEQAILNLIVNSRDAMPAGGRIVVRTSVEEAASESGPTQRVRLTVTDDGVGIAEDIREHIFEPFFTTKETGAGSGLGLSMVYGVVHQSEGTLEVESAAGAGTSMHLLFPVLERPSAPPQEGEGPGPLETREAEGTVLLVEDEDSVRSLLGQALAEEGFRVTAVESSRAALDYIESSGSPPDLLVSDVVLGGTNGVELARMLRGTHPHLSVLFVSGYAESALEEELSLDPGMAFLRKPFRMETLLGTVHRLMDERAVPSGSRPE